MEGLVIAFACVQIIVLVLYTRSIQKKIDDLKKENSSAREQKILKLYGNIEDLMDTFESYIGEVREELDKEHAALTEMSRQAAILFTQAQAVGEQLGVRRHEPAPQETLPETKAGRQEKPARAPEKREDKKPVEKSRLSAKDREILERFSGKSQKVRFLMSKGFSAAEVARELSIGMGEVRLIAGLEK